MKRILLLALVVLSAAACKKITPETRIGQIGRYFDGKENVYSARLQQLPADRQADYLTLQLAGEIGASDLWTLEVDGMNALVAEFPGRDKNPMLSFLSASLDDPDACAVVLEVLEAYRKIKIPHKNTIRAIFYAPAPDSARLDGLSVVNQELQETGEIVGFDIEVSTREGQPKHCFVLEDLPAFTQTLFEAVPGYLAPLGDYQLAQGPYPNPDWPLKCPIYRYGVDPEEFQREAAAVAAFTYLLN